MTLNHEAVWAARVDDAQTSATIEGALLPFADMEEINRNAYFDDTGAPSAKGWKTVACPGLDDPNAFALKTTGNAHTPVYHDGAILVVSPRAGVRRGDRVCVMTHDAGCILGHMRRLSALRLEIQALNPLGGVQCLEVHNVKWMARIMWARQ